MPTPFHRPPAEMESRRNEVDLDAARNVLQPIGRGMSSAAPTQVEYANPLMARFQVRRNVHHCPVRGSPRVPSSPGASAARRPRPVIWPPAGACTDRRPASPPARAPRRSAAADAGRRGSVRLGHQPEAGGVLGLRRVTRARYRQSGALTTLAAGSPEGSSPSVRVGAPQPSNRPSGPKRYRLLSRPHLFRN